MYITIIGAGNVGSHLARALYAAGHPIQQIYSRQLEHAKPLANLVGAEPINHLSKISPESRFFLIAVRDDAIESITAELSAYLPKGAVLAHTSGATPSTVLALHSPDYGVFYPLQTLSKNHPADFQQIPMCIDGSSPKVKQQLQQLAQTISQQVYLADDEQRALLHLTAVFINNFTNALLQASHELTKRANLPQEILTPLLNATIRKGTENEPRSVQTGPAIRGDQQTIDRHLQQLTNHPELSTVYKAITAYIQTF